MTYGRRYKGVIVDSHTVKLDYAEHAPRPRYVGALAWILEPYSDEERQTYAPVPELKNLYTGAMICSSRGEIATIVSSSRRDSTITIVSPWFTSPGVNDTFTIIDPKGY